MESRFACIFGAGKKPVIAMAHLPALPGTPLYDAAAGMQGVVDAVARDVAILLDEGVDAVLFCNENDRPYRLDASLAAHPVAPDAFVRESTRRTLRKSAW